MSDSSWEFHFRNFRTASVEVRVHHAGCAKTPWYGGRPGCWTKTIPHNPTGGHESVYIPANWVVNFGEWVDVYKDLLRFVKDIGLFIASEGADVEALIQALADVFAITKDVVKHELDKLTQQELDELLEAARGSFEASCQRVNVSPATIRDYAKTMRLSKDWAFVAGEPYWRYLHEASDLTGKHGWSVVYDDGTVRQARAAFVSEAKLYYLIDDPMRDHLWTTKE